MYTAEVFEVSEDIRWKFELILNDSAAAALDPIIRTVMKP
jgi:hypothetical protein